MKLARRAGATSQIIQVFIRDSSSTTGAGLASLTSGSSGLTAYYHRDTDTTATAISLTSMTIGTFASGGFAAIDNTNMPGWYQLCVPNAALASGAASCGIHLKGATNMAPLPIEIDLDAQVDVYLWNGTAVASPATAGVPDVNVKNIGGTVTAGAAGYVGIDWAHVNAPTSTVALTNTSINSAGSVTGNVGGNVVGSVASVTAPVTATISGTVSANVTSINSVSASGVTTIGTTIGGSGDAYARLGAPVGATISADIQTATADILAQSAPSAATVANAVLTSVMTEAYPVAGSSFTLAQALYNLVQRLGQMTISGTTMTVLKRNGSTAAKTYTLNNAITPTNITETT